MTAPHVEKARVGAWLLEFAVGIEAIVGVGNLVHLLQAPELHEAPQSPRYCRHVLVWEDQPLAVWNVAAFVRDAHVAPGSCAAVMRYARVPGGPSALGALMLDRPPRRIMVDDRDACALPIGAPRWQPLASACLHHESRAIPILNLVRLFDHPAAFVKAA